MQVIFVVLGAVFTGRVCRGAEFEQDVQGQLKVMFLEHLSDDLLNAQVLENPLVDPQRQGLQPRRKD